MVFCVALSLTRAKRPTAVGDEEIGIFVQIDEHAGAAHSLLERARARASRVSIFLNINANFKHRSADGIFRAI